MTAGRVGPDCSPGHGIDRTAPITVTVDGRPMAAFAGDTVASAHIASGRLSCGPSLYLSRPRGIVAAGVEEPNALLTVDARTPGGPSESMLPATTVEAVEGLSARWLQGMGVLDPLGDDAYYDRKYVHTDVLIVGAGPAGIAAAREAAKTGARTVLVDEQSMPGGSLLSGRGETVDGVDAVAWARTALERLTGQPDFAYMHRTTAIGSYDANYVVAVERRAADVDTPAAPGVPRERVWHIRAKRVILATGAHERPLVFADNDRPGVMLAGAVRTYLNRYAVAAGKNIILATTDDSVYGLLEDLHSAGIAVPLVVDSRPEPSARARAALEATGARGAFGAAVVGTSAGADASTEVGTSEGVGTSADGQADAGDEGRVTAVSFAPVDEFGRPSGDVETAAADTLAVSGGHSPVLHLHTQRQGRVHWDESLAAFVPEAPVAGQAVVGSANGAVSLGVALEQGAHAGHSAAAETGARGPLVVPTASAVAPGPVRPLWLIAAPHGSAAPGSPDRDGGPGESDLGESAASDGRSGVGDSRDDRPGTSDDEDDDAAFAPERWSTHFVDLQRDQTVADVLRAIGAGMRSVEHIKRYTSISTAGDQGKTSSVNAMGVIASLLEDADPASVGTSTNRPPYTPVAFAALAGRRRGELYEPARVTNIHPWHVAHGAEFEDVGQWKRPRYFPRTDEDMDAAVLRECAAVRTTVGFQDVSTLGKIEIRGTDAPEFLNRIYTNGFAKLPVGRGRYGLMCGADGMLFDDGVTMRLAEDRFLMTTTTGGAAGVLDWLEEWHQTEWPHMDVFFTSVTEQWNTIAVAGPRSRDVVAKIAPDIDVSNEAFGFMEFREAQLSNGIPARICRISFSGELAFEVNVSAFYGLAAWELVAEAGEEFDITPYGTETMHVLRAEKGLVIIGQDTDGTVTPHDAGMGWAVSRLKDFIGKRSFQRADTVRPDRKHFVGVLPVDGVTRLDEGAQLIAAGTPVTPEAGPVPMIGHVTSSYVSAELGRPFGLALVENGFNRMGEIVQSPVDGTLVDVEITSSVFIDPEGKRRDG
ncbi:2Fe-2S iron-sulfur cluster-binding protein [Brevibacterium yomogidense]|uniref:Sarcosine oxidase alpha subunit n=1 Tax=Brevibacterium yomogidense TaxID=946573 RepID=A0A1X6WTW2_9MICO|nr:2Fe-2S iron-sulfur cluster-binding protein [Brevibacterium yomogidense]SLM88411.1 Sarcosine oxidase alpha subunit [Brevibacterium yomogidense]